MNQYARVAGVSYLIIFVCGIFANFAVLESLIVPNDGAATALNISESESLFRIAILSFIVMVIFDVVVSWALYVLFKPIRINLALIMAWLRLINSAIFAVALIHLYTVLQLLNGADIPAIGDPSQVHAQIMLALNGFDTTWMIGLIFFGLHLPLLGYLIIKSDSIPKIIGILLIAAGLGYLLDSAALTLLPNYETFAEIFTAIVVLLGVVGELSLTLWLLIKGFEHPTENGAAH